MHWLVDMTIVIQLLEINNCSVIVDGSFFSEHPEYISAHWKFIYNKKVVGSRSFVVKVLMYL